MAVLLVELHGIKRGSVLPRRVLIGRRSMNHLVIDDPGVSRMHAWIDGEGDRYYINDAGSRTGTRVNGQRIVSRHLLGDEDEISVGPARLTFLAESRLRPGVEPIDLVSPPKIAAAENGIAFDCPACTAPLWATLNFAGGTGQCKYCGNDLVVPKPKAAKANPATARSSPARPATPPALRAFPPQASDEMQVSLHRDVAGQPVSEQQIAATEPTALLPSPGTPGEGQGEGLPFSRPAVSRKPNAPLHNPLSEYREREKSAGVAIEPRTSKPPAPPAFGQPVPPAFAQPAPAAASVPSLRRTREGEQICGVCQSAISVFEEQTSCPTCGLVFHADCWTENYGCSAYGCPQVNALAPPAEHNHSKNGSAHGAAPEPDSNNAHAHHPGANNSEIDEPARFPWEFLLLAGSVFSALVGALTFGLPSLAVAGGTVTYMARTRGNGNAHRGIIILSAGLALLGVIAGVPVSWFLYFGGPHS
jgi:hypothetical protein